MSASNFQQLKVHVGHKIVCVIYGDRDNVAVECNDCHEVLLDYDNPGFDGECPYCEKRNWNHLEGHTFECYDCGNTFTVNEMGFAFRDTK